ncbi:type II secretion system F family protein [Corynebacterium sp. LK2510]|uniref:type II secretion system F family protein n=1 Tax=Corynebacterium sp. LK2510 TaxID=3110472 RepID=UPI0034CF5FBA
MTPILLACAAALGAPAPRGRVDTARGRTLSPAWIPLLTAAATIGVIAVDRVAIVLSACAAGATVVYALARRRQARASRQRTEATAVFLGHVVTNLKAGSTLAGAVERAAGHLPDGAPASFRTDIARATAAVVSGVPAESVLRGAVSPELREVGALWALSSSRGVPIADLLAGARDRLDHARRHRAATEAALAGPKTTAVVLAALPATGVAMGTAMGAEPLSILLGRGPGGWLLVVGTALVCAGFLACQRIIARAAA